MIDPLLPARRIVLDPRWMIRIPIGKERECIDIADAQTARRQLLLRRGPFGGIECRRIRMMQIGHQLDAGISDVGQGVDCLGKGVLLERIG